MTDYNETTIAAAAIIISIVLNDEVIKELFISSVKERI